MARCGDCNKFVSLEEQDPEVESVEYDQGEVRATVRIVNACAECGTELREASLEMDGEAPEGWDAHDPDQVRQAALAAWREARMDGGGEPDDDTLAAIEAEADKHALEAEEERSERTSRQDGKPGTPSRYRKTYYGATVTVTLSCPCGWSATTELSDEVQAGAMDEL